MTGSATATASTGVVNTLQILLCIGGFVGIVQTTSMGLALAASYLLVKRNLWVLVLAHACIDTLLLGQMYLGPRASGTG